MARNTEPNRRTVLHEQVLAEWEEEYDKPRAEGMIVGFSGLDPDRKQPAGGGGGVTESQVRYIAREEINANKCDCPGMATNAEFDEMLRVVGLK